MFCLILVCNIWPSSVLPSSGIGKFDFRHVLPNSGMGKMHVLPKSVLPSSGAPLYDRSVGLVTLDSHFTLGWWAEIQLPSSPGK